MTPGVEVLAMFRAAVGAAVCIGTLAGPVSAQVASDVFYNSPDATLKQEIAAYVGMIDQLKATGQPATVAGSFSFTNAAANSPLFDPYPAMRRTINVTIGNGLCWAVPSGAIANYASTSTIVSPLSDTPATINHLNTIVGAAQTDDVTFGFTGNDLVSQGIPVAPVSGASAPAASYTPDAATSAWIFNIESHAIGEAISFQPATDVSNRLLGQPRDVDALAYSIWEHSSTVLGKEPDDIVRLDATFGLFGSLPMLAVWYTDGYFLVDGTNGLVSGPYLEGTSYNAVELLLNHSSYIAGTQSLVLRAATGCEDNGLAGRWRTRPPFDPATPSGPVNPSHTDPAVRRPWQPYLIVPLDRTPTKYHDTYRNDFPVPAGPIPATHPSIPFHPGRPTVYDCEGVPGGGEACTTLEVVCFNNNDCYYRQSTCSFVSTPPYRDGSNPWGNYPSYPGDPNYTGTPPSNVISGCKESWYY